jgi:ABC-type nitrate/sulfonate/bicarbonate transport system substrate-binding protein
MTERVLAAFVPLVDCAVLVAARELGFAAAEDIALDLVREPSWASLRDHLCLGHVDCAHALAPLPVALKLGTGYVPVDCVVPFVLGRGGNAITVSNRLFDEMQSASGGFAMADGPARAGAALAQAAKRRSAPLTFGMVFPFSNHNYDLRYWLAAAGLHPDRDVRLVVIPPPLMVEALRAGLVDGFCVGEPWNSHAIDGRLAHIVATQSQLFPQSAEKVLATRAAFCSDERRLTRLLRALSAAAEWADRAENHARLAKILCRAAYVGAPAPLIENALAGRLQLGGGAEVHAPDFMFFHRHAASAPMTADGLWTYAQMVRWGQIPPSPGDQALAASVYRPDLFLNADSGPVQTLRSVCAFDGVEFTPGDVSGYLQRFALGTPFMANATN